MLLSLLLITLLLTRNISFTLSATLRNVTAGAGLSYTLRKRYGATRVAWCYGQRWRRLRTNCVGRRADVSRMRFFTLRRGWIRIVVSFPFSDRQVIIFVKENSVSKNVTQSLRTKGSSKYAIFFFFFIICWIICGNLATQYPKFSQIRLFQKYIITAWISRPSFSL